MQKALSPFQTAGTLLHHLHADMKAVRLETGRHQYFSTSNDAAPMYAATIQTRRKHTQPEPETSAVGTFTRSLNGSSLWFWFSLLLLSCFGWFYVSSSHCKLNSPQSDASVKQNPLLFYFIHCKLKQCLSVLCGLFWKERRTTRQSCRFFTVISAAVIAKAKLLSPFNLLMCEIVKTMRLVSDLGF